MNEEIYGSKIAAEVQKAIKAPSPEELNDFVSRFSMEYDLTYPQILGVLSLLKRQIEDEFMYGDEEENEDREWED